MNHDLLGDSKVELDDEAELLPLPFVFPHYLRFYEKAWVSCNGALIFDPVLDQLTKQAAVLGSGIGPHAVLAAMWGDLVCPEGSKISARHGEGLTAVRFEGLRQKSNPMGNLTFEVRLHRDGRILLLLEDFPANSTALSQVQVGLQPATGARALSVGADLPWSSGPPLAVSFTPWLMVENKKVEVPPNETLTVDLVFERQHDLYGWLFFYAERSIGSWHPRRNVRFTQRVFRYFWSLSAWDGGMHSGVCATGFVRRRNRTCFGSDAQVYDDSFCIGSCMDKDPMLYWDYPNKRIWKDGYENRCEDYRVLDLCREDGYGSKWQPWWGSFDDWVTSGLGAGTACCLCGGGTYTPALPHIEETCPSVSCPANSVGSNVLEGQNFAKKSLECAEDVGRCRETVCRGRKKVMTLPNTAGDFLISDLHQVDRSIVLKLLNFNNRRAIGLNRYSSAGSVHIVDLLVLGRLQLPPSVRG